MVNKPDRITKTRWAKISHAHAVGNTMSEAAYNLIFLSTAVTHPQDLDLFPVQIVCKSFDLISGYFSIIFPPSQLRGGVTFSLPFPCLRQE